MPPASPLSSAVARSTRARPCTRALLCLSTAVGLLLGCSPEKALWQSGVGGPGLLDKPMRVERVTPRGDYLSALLAADDFSIEVYLPDNEACRAIFRVGSELSYMEGAPGGIYQKDDLVCNSAGIGSLREWRSRRPRARTTGSVIARAQANYQLVYQDEDVAFLRGRFPLTGHISFSEMGDVIAVVGKTPHCEAPIGRSTSSMEYYPTGKNVLTLVSTRGQCQITGLIAPFGVGRPTAAP